MKNMLRSMQSHLICELKHHFGLLLVYNYSRQLNRQEMYKGADIVRLGMDYTPY